jgi:hypothetical protein
VHDAAAVCGPGWRLRSALVTDCPIILAQCLPECLLCPESDLIAAGQ